jgi:hypothetical protein
MLALRASFVLLSLSAASLIAQDKIRALGGQTERANNVMILADTTSGFHPLALVTVTYGAAEWKAEFAEKADELKGKIARLGRDNWPIFDSTVAMKFGDVTVPVGIYYLGIERSKDGNTWSLVFIDPAKAKAAGAWPFAADPAPRTVSLPLTHTKSDKVAEKLSIGMENNKDNPTHGTLTIAWGDHKLTGAFDVVLEKKTQPKDAASGKGKK